MQLTSGASPNTKIVIKGGLRKQLPIAEEFKQQGNSYFVSLEYAKAIECYTRCIDAIENHPTSKQIEKPLEMKMIVYSNKAQSYLKLKAYKKALDDANKACSLDSTHVKSIGRKDFLAALFKEPTNQQFRHYLGKT